MEQDKNITYTVKHPGRLVLILVLSVGIILLALAWALFRLGRTEEALQTIRRAVALIPSPEAEILEHYGDIAASAGQKEEARKAYEQALKLKPANADSLRRRLGDL